MPGKVRIKFGQLEFEYETEHDISLAELPNALSSIVEVLGSSSVSTEAPASEVHKGQRLEKSTKAITAALSSRTGPDLFLAALAHHQLVLGKSKATRKEIQDEMKTVTDLYNETIRKNLSHTITNLLKAGKINEPRSGEFALTTQSSSEIYEKIK